MVDDGARTECRRRKWEDELCKLSPTATSSTARRIADELLQIDWLLTNYCDEDGVFFHEFLEQDISFLPTYRVSRQTNTRYDLGKGRRGRYPGYADRILHCPSLDRASSSYRSWPVQGSDHLPVSLDLALWGATVRIVTFNCGGDGRAMSSFWKSLVMPYPDVPHILCLQELRRPRSRDALVPAKVLQRFEAEVHVRCNDRIPVVQPLVSDFSQAIVILSPKSGDATLRAEAVSACRSSNWLATKGWLHADVYSSASELPLRVYCAHAPFVDERTTARFFAKLERDVARFRRHTYGVVPILVAGDLNSRSVPIGLRYAKNVRRCPGPCTPAQPL